MNLMNTESIFYQVYLNLLIFIHSQLLTMQKAFTMWKNNVISILVLKYNWTNIMEVFDTQKNILTEILVQ